MNDLENSDKKSLQQYLRKTLGEDFYNLCDSFFQSIWNSNATYKVFMPKCMNLMDLFYRCADESIRNRRLEDTFYSDQALLANAREIAEFYEENGFMPRIVIADEILIHGRTFNGFIMEFIEKIRQCLSKDSVDFLSDRDKVEADVLDAISIRVIMQDYQSSLLPSRILRRVKADETCSVERRLPFLSCALSAVVNGSFSSVRFVPYLRIRHDDTRLNSVLRQADKDMISSQYCSRFMNKAWMRLLTTPTGDVKAIYTLNIVTNENGFCTLVPFVFLANTVEIDESFFNYFDDESRMSIQLAFDHRKDSPASLTEALIALFSRNILLLLFKDSDAVALSTCIDYNKFKMSFRSRTGVTESFCTSICNRKTPWFLWEQMDELILKLTEHSKPLYFVHNNTVDISDHLCDEIERTVEDNVTQRIFEDEYHSYRQRMMYEFRTCRHMPSKPIAVVFDEIHQKISPTVPDEAFLVCVTSMLLRFMNAGTIEFVCEYNDKEKQSSVNLQVSYESSFAFIQKYADCIPALTMIERDSMGDANLFVHEIRKFFVSRIDAQREVDLEDFAMWLWCAGHRVKDWNIDLTGWSEWLKESDNTLTFDPKEIQLRNESAAIIQMKTQSRFAYQYYES